MVKVSSVMGGALQWARLLQERSGGGGSFPFNTSFFHEIIINGRPWVKVTRHLCSRTLSSVVSCNQYRSHFNTVSTNQANFSTFFTTLSLPAEGREQARTLNDWLLLRKNTAKASHFFSTHFESGFIRMLFHWISFQAPTQSVEGT
jgi:hypothetical protein